MVQHILSLSGGLDSTVLCACLLAQGGPGSVEAVFFRYGSKHGPWEEKAARALAEHFNIALTVIDLRDAFGHAVSALLKGDARPVPKEAYNSSSLCLTAVPGRNLVFASVLACLAESRAVPHVALATHTGDHALYPDCRPSFNRALEKVIMESSGGTVRAVTPFSGMDKAEIVARGAELEAPFELTRSCYEETETSCGMCGSCRERMAAFAACRLPDPALL